MGINTDAIFALLHEQGVAQADMARALGESPQTINNWARRGIPAAKAHSLAGYLRFALGVNIDADQLLAGNVPNSERPPTVRIPRLELDASAGPGGLPQEHPDVVEHLDVMASWVKRALGVGDAEALRVIGIKGDSMSPTMNHGDLAFADTSVQRFDGEGIYALIWQDQLLVKRLRVAGEARLAIHSDNSAAYPPELVSTDSAAEIAICARVVGWWSLRRW